MKQKRLGRTATARDDQRGFTLIELMVVLIVMAILAALAIPAFTARIVRQQIDEAIPLTTIVKQAVAQAYVSSNYVFPASNLQAQLPVPEKIVNNYVSAVAVQNGVINLTFGNSAHAVLKGKVLTIRPAIVEGSPIVPIAWVCGSAAVPNNMTVQGANATTVPIGMLPSTCR